MYIFFVRHFNDIDHMTPIIWQMSRRNHSVALYCMNPEYDLHRDYRIQFLKQIGVPVQFIYDAFASEFGPKNRGLRLLSRASFAIARMLDSRFPPPFPDILADFRRLAQKRGRKCYEKSRSTVYTESWARVILEKSAAQILCFDWVSPHRYVVAPFLRAAKEMSIPTVSLPHGIFVYTNDSVTTEAGDDEKNYAKFNLYDHVVVQNDLFKEVLGRSGVSRDKIIVLGSARYCSEWMQQNKEILPRKLTSTKNSTRKLKVVFMTTRPKYKLHIDKMISTFDLLSKINEIDLVVKPHTRSGKEANIYDNIPVTNVSDVSSVELCEWADVMLVIGSSILIEALLQNKPVLYLKYLHDNTTLYEQLQACWTIHSAAELKSALLSLHQNQQFVPYSAESVDKFFGEIIYGGQIERNVLGHYERFIVDCGSKSVGRI